jgi:hypothetical protein
LFPAVNISLYVAGITKIAWYHSAALKGDGGYLKTIGVI